MKIIKQVILFIIHHFIRPFWNIPIMLISYLFYIQKINKDKRISILKKQIIPQLIDSDLEPITKFDRILDDFRLLFNIAYRWDNFKGILDHDPLNIDYVAVRGGDDCDSIKVFMPILKKLGAKKIIRWMVIDKVNPKTAHYICTFKFQDTLYFMTNFRNPIEIKSYDEIETALKKYFPNWKVITKIPTIY